MTSNTQSDSPSGVVWILGAGFSRFLGGPLFDELFTSDSKINIQAVYGPEIERESFDQVLKWHEDRQVAARADKRPTPAPRNAEELLEFLDRTQDKNSTALAIANAHLPGLDIERARSQALRVLALETSAFLVNQDVGGERWAPYRTWNKGLRPEDSVITFNYDLVPDLLATHGDCQDYNKRVHYRAAGIKHLPRLLKLHGSVDWEPKGDAAERRGIDVLKRPLLQPMIATPGDTKGRLINSELGPLWKAAASAIENAKALVFVGYSMPSTDAGTKQWFVDRLRAWISNPQNNKKRTHHAGAGISVEVPAGPLPIHIVLGPDPAHKDPVRLKFLFESIDTHRLTPKIWPLGAEDFLGLLTRDQLLI